LVENQRDTEKFLSLISGIGAHRQTIEHKVCTSCKSTAVADVSTEPVRAHAIILPQLVALACISACQH
jgi:hypothetical protein